MVEFFKKHEQASLPATLGKLYTNNKTFPKLKLEFDVAYSEIFSFTCDEHGVIFPTINSFLIIELSKQPK